MTQHRSFVPKLTLMMLVGVPLCMMGLLTVIVLFPTLKNPESNIYGSPFGYPALKRLLGQPIKVQTVAVERKAVGDSLAASGESVALQDVSVSPLVDGTVEQVFVAEGDIVRKGQPLFKIQDAPFQDAVDTAKGNLAIAENTLKSLKTSDPSHIAELEANVESAQQRLEIATIRFDQFRDLQTNGAIAQAQLYQTQDEYVQRQRELVEAQEKLAQHQNTTASDLEDAMLTLNNSRIALQEAMRDLSETIVYAPTSGLVSQVQIYSGETASTLTSVIHLTQDMVFKAFIDQASLNQVTIGEPATIRLTAYPGRTFEGKILRINPTIDTEVNQLSQVGVDRQYTYSVWVQVDDLEMPPGLQGYAMFGQNKERAVIPESAVTHLSNGEGMVMVARNGEAVVQSVRLGELFDNQREVLTGLEVGDQVVLSPRALNPGDQLKPQIAQSSL